MPSRDIPLHPSRPRSDLSSTCSAIATKGNRKWKNIPLDPKSQKNKNTISCAKKPDIAENNSLRKSHCQSIHPASIITEYTPTPPQHCQAKAAMANSVPLQVERPVWVLARLPGYTIPNRGNKSLEELPATSTLSCPSHGFGNGLPPGLLNQHQKRPNSTDRTFTMECQTWEKSEVTTTLLSTPGSKGLPCRDIPLIHLVWCKWVVAGYAPWNPTHCRVHHLA